MNTMTYFTMLGIALTVAFVVAFIISKLYMRHAKAKYFGEQLGDAHEIPVDM